MVLAQITTSFFTIWWYVYHISSVSHTYLDACKNTMIRPIKSQKQWLCRIRTKIEMNWEIPCSLHTPHRVIVRAGFMCEASWWNIPIASSLCFDSDNERWDGVLRTNFGRLPPQECYGIVIHLLWSTTFSRQIFENDHHVSIAKGRNI